MEGTTVENGATPLKERHLNVSPFAGNPAVQSALVDVLRLITACQTELPFFSVPAQRVTFGTSGHRGTAFNKSVNEGYLLAITQAICVYRKRQGNAGNRWHA